LAAQSLSGALSWAMKSDQSGSLYELTYGEITALTIEPAKLFDATGVKLSNVLDVLVALAEKIQENGYGNSIKFDFGREAYNALLNLVVKLPNDSRIRANVNGNSISIAGYEISLNASRYFDPKDDSYKYAIDPKGILAWDSGAGFELKYLAIDNISAGFSPTPLYLNAYQTPNGKSWVVEAESKPLPIPIVRAMAKAVVVS
jgi:hypothetical protein